MTRLAGFSLLWYCIASIVVIVFGFFGSLKHGEVTYIGMLIFLFWGLVFVSQRELKVDIFILKPRSLRLGFYFLVALIDLLAILAILRFGPSPVLGALVGIDPGALLFQGLYREQLPLRALGPPAAVAVGIFAYLGIKKNILRKSDGFIAGFSIIFFVSVYETRHILIWIFIYLISLAIAENYIYSLRLLF
jgi:hypothetical protein